MQQKNLTRVTCFVSYLKRTSVIMKLVMFMDKREFGLFFAKLRESNGYKSQRELADKSGVSHSTINRIESGSHKVTPDTLKALSKYLKGVSYEELMEKAGYITKEDIIKTALPHIDFNFSHITETSVIKKDDAQNFYETLKNNPDEILGLLDGEVRSEFISFLINNIKDENPSIYEKILAKTVSEKEKKIIDMLVEVDDLTEEKLNQVVDFVKFLKSKD